LSFLDNQKQTSGALLGKHFLHSQGIRDPSGGSGSTNNVKPLVWLIAEY